MTLQDAEQIDIKCSRFMASKYLLEVFYNHIEEKSRPVVSELNAIINPWQKLNGQNDL